MPSDVQHPGLTLRERRGDIFSRARRATGRETDPALNEELPRSVGFLNPDLYDFMNGSGFNQVTSGTNGYPAQTGWDCCTGLGTPSGNNLLAYLRSRQTLSPT